MKRNVVIYVDHLLGPSETFIRSQAEGLRKFTPVYAGSRIIPGIATPPERTIVANNGAVMGRLREIAFKMWGFSPHLHSAVERLDPVVVHAHYGPNALRALPLAKWSRCPLIVTFHGSDANMTDEAAARSHLSHRVYARKKDVVKREAALFLAVSDFVHLQLLKQGFPPQRIRTHYVGINTESFRPDPAIEREPVVLFVGNFIENKGGAQLIRAMASVQNENPEVELVMIGDGPLRAELELLAQQKLRKYRYLGYQSHQSVRTWMNRAMVLAQPSLTLASGAAEGLPTVLGEAMAVGTPVVSSRMAGIPEIVSDRYTGLLVDERDERTLAASISMLLRDPTVWLKFSRAGRDRVVTRFNLRRQCEILDGMYEEVSSGNIRESVQEC